MLGSRKSNRVVNTFLIKKTSFVGPSSDLRPVGYFEHPTRTARRVVSAAPTKVTSIINDITATPTVRIIDHMMFVRQRVRGLMTPARCELTQAPQTRYLANNRAEFVWRQRLSDLQQ